MQMGEGTNQKAGDDPSQRGLSPPSRVCMLRRYFSFLFCYLPGLNQTGRYYALADSQSNSLVASEVPQQNVSARMSSPTENTQHTHEQETRRKTIIRDKNQADLNA